MAFPPLERRRDLTQNIIDADVPGLRAEGSHGDAEHRRELGVAVKEIGALALSSRPKSSFCSADTTVSSGSFISVTGMAQSLFVPLTGNVEITGNLYVEEITPGSFSIRIVEGANVLWTVTVQPLGVYVLEDPQTAKWTMPIGGPELLAASGATIYSLDVEIAAPTGSYKVLTGTGKESFLRGLPWPTIELGQ